MSRSATEVLGLLIDSTAYAGLIERGAEYAEGFPLATITAKDGTKYNVQVRKIASDKPEEPTPESVSKSVKLKRKTS